jgi:hypothetical protein
LGRAGVAIELQNDELLDPLGFEASGCGPNGLCELLEGSGQLHDLDQGDVFRGGWLHIDLLFISVIMAESHAASHANTLK